MTQHTETATPFTDFLVGKHDEQGGYGTAGYNELLEHAREQERELATAPASNSPPSAMPRRST